MATPCGAGVMRREDMARLRAVSVSQGLMLESTSQRLMLPGGPHHGCADKVPGAQGGAGHLPARCCQLHPPLAPC